MTMKRKIVYLLIMVTLFGSATNLMAQLSTISQVGSIQNNAKNDFRCIVIFGNSSFSHNVNTDEKFPHLELKSGVSYARILSRRTSLVIGLNFGLKFTRKPVGFSNLDSNQIQASYFFIQDMNSMLLKKHGFVELPFELQMSISKKIKLSTGAAVRYYFRTKYNTIINPDRIGGHEDLGLIVGGNYQLGNKIALFAKYYHGFNKLYRINDILQGERYAKNRVVGIGVEYDF